MISIKVIIADNAKTQITLSIDKDSLVIDLMHEIYSLNNNLSVDNMSLKLGETILVKNKKLSYCGLKNNSTIEQVKSDLKDVPGLVISYEPDIMTDDSSNEARAKMPCGHVVSRESMTAYLKSLIEKRQIIIKCPGDIGDNKLCNYVWSFSLCKKIGVFTQQENNFFETNFSAIFLSEKFETKSCPCCKSIIMKPQNLKTNRVSCHVCGSNGYDFCWNCLKKWSECGGKPGCGQLKDLEELLQTCQTKSIEKGVNVIVPVYRACPKCTTPINHKSDCKHISCIGCHSDFCFVCLAIKNNGVWPCGSYSNLCQVAPRQTMKDLIKK